MNVVKIVVLSFLICFVLGSHPASASDKCIKILETSCTTCHTKFNFCKNLGIPKVFWEKKIKLMKTVGANISKKEQDEVISCLVSMSDNLKAFCKEY